MGADDIFYSRESASETKPRINIRLLKRSSGWTKFYQDNSNIFIFVELSELNTLDPDETAGYSAFQCDSNCLKKAFNSFKETVQ